MLHEAGAPSLDGCPSPPHVSRAPARGEPQSQEAARIWVAALFSGTTLTAQPPRIMTGWIMRATGVSIGRHRNGSTTQRRYTPHNCFPSDLQYPDSLLRPSFLDVNPSPNELLFSC